MSKTGKQAQLEELTHLGLMKQVLVLINFKSGDFEKLS